MYLPPPPPGKRVPATTRLDEILSSLTDAVDTVVMDLPELTLSEIEARLSGAIGNADNAREDIVLDVESVPNRSDLGVDYVDGRQVLVNRAPRPTSPPLGLIDAEKVRDRVLASGRTLVVHRCGHTGAYLIRKAGATEWLREQLCVPCRQREV